MIRYDAHEENPTLVTQPRIEKLNSVIKPLKGLKNIEICKNTTFHHEFIPVRLSVGLIVHIETLYGLHS